MASYLGGVTRVMAQCHTCAPYSSSYHPPGLWASCPGPLPSRRGQHYTCTVPPSARRSSENPASSRPSSYLMSYATDRPFVSGRLTLVTPARHVWTAFHPRSLSHDNGPGEACSHTFPASSFSPPLQGRTPKDKPGAGAVGTQLGVTLAQVRLPLGKNHEVYDAEIVGALVGLRAAVASPCTQLATNIHVALDNQEASQRLLTIFPSKTSQKEILEFPDLAASWPARQTNAIAQPGQVHVIWSPGHIGIAGNEQGNKLANEACRLSPPPMLTTSLAGARSHLRQRFRKLFTEWWESNEPRTYKELGIPWPKKPADELRLPSQNFGYPVQCRTEHGDFYEYHTWLNHTDAALHCAYGRRKTPAFRRLSGSACTIGPHRPCPQPRDPSFSFRDSYRSLPFFDIPEQVTIPHGFVPYYPSTRWDNR